MHGLQGIMAAASLSTLLWRAASSTSRSLSTSPSSSSSRRGIVTSLAFQNNASRAGRRRTTFGRPIVATAFSNDGNANINGAGSALRTVYASPLKSSSSSSQVEGARPSSTSSSEKQQQQRKPIPTILLAGFLGSGKTTTLKHLLENNSGMKIGTIVNDVASVNIDAKLISNSDSRYDNDTNNAYADGVVELQNGCACCSLADELFTSVVRLTKGGERELDAIVVELSGVADPAAVKDNWEQARMQGHPATRLASLHRTVTLVDACTFGTDWMTWDTAYDRDGWTEPGDDCAGTRKVPELLAEQVEAADLLLVNKVDLAGETQVGVASGVARGLNGKARLVEVQFGRVGARELLGDMLGEKEEEEEDGHSHEHEHGHGHSDEHDHDREASACADPDCTDTSHSHAHEHSSACSEPDCTDSSHSHSHEHTAASDCSDPDCTDTSHSHSHEHNKSAATKTAADKLGISSFVYRSSTPFDTQRLLALLNRWPVPIKDSLDFGLVMGMGQESQLAEETPEEHRAFVGVLRSKGFCWMAPTKWSTAAAGKGGDAWRHDTAMYWSHAGKHFGITSAGKWWGSLGSRESCRPYFEGNMEEYERIMREDWVSEEWGDRRQELVFIGAKLDEEEIRAALDACLCTDEEMELYRARLRNYMDASLSDLRSGGPSLFDVGGMDHIEKN